VGVPSVWIAALIDTMFSFMLFVLEVLCKLIFMFLSITQINIFIGKQPLTRTNRE